MESKNYLFKEILNTISEGMVFHAADGSITHTNLQAEKILGLSKEQILGKTPMDPLWRTFKEDMTPFSGEDHPSTYTLKTQKEKHDVVMGILRPDDSFVWININATPLFQEGEFLGAVMTFSDVTQQRADIEKIKTQSGYLDMILTATPMILFAIDKDGLFTYSRGAGLKALGLKDDQVLGQNVYELYKDNPDIVTNIKDTLKNGTEYHYETQIGELYYISHMVPKFNMNNDIDGLIGISYDVTENEKNKKAMILNARQAQIGEMLSVISHQWRQPLTAISSSLVQMRLHLEMQECLSEKLIPMIEKSEKLIVHLSETINHFRDFFKPDKDRELIEVSSVVDSVKDLMADTLRSYGIEVVNINELAGESFYSFHHDLVQVILNLFANVVDIVKEKRLQDIVIKVHSFIENESVIIEVSDNAGGINKADIDQLFIPYFTTKKELQGTGLGLYMCQNIIQDHCKGKMEAFNRNDGAVFRLELPLTVEKA